MDDDGGAAEPERGDCGRPGYARAPLLLLLVSPLGADGMPGDEGGGPPFGCVEGHERRAQAGQSLQRVSLQFQRSRGTIGSDSFAARHSSEPPPRAPLQSSAAPLPPTPFAHGVGRNREQSRVSAGPANSLAARLHPQTARTCTIGCSSRYCGSGAKPSNNRGWIARRRDGIAGRRHRLTNSVLAPLSDNVRWCKSLAVRFLARTCLWRHRLRRASWKNLQTLMRAGA